MKVTEERINELDDRGMNIDHFSNTGKIHFKNEEMIKDITISLEFMS